MSYTMIADVGNTILNLLKESLVPDIIHNESLIGLCSPNDSGDFILGLYLYHIEQNQHMRMNSYIDQGVEMQVSPPIYLNLYYMITAHSQGDIKFKSYENQVILGKIIQTLNDCALLEDKYGNKLRIDMIDMSWSEKKNILSNFEAKNNNLSLFYKVAPVEIESTNSRRVVRVKGIDFSTSAYNQNN